MNRLAPRLAALALCAACGLALAQPRTPPQGAVERVQRLAQSGDVQQALALAAAHLEANPDDVQMRFVRANALAQSGQAEQAEAELESLTRNHPELAEPWNNLAVRYAARGELGKAREALEQALLADPAYATAQENLGDVHARLAASAWQQAAAQAALPAEQRQRLQDKAGRLEALLPAAN